MKSWTRTLNLDDSHTLLAAVQPGMTFESWKNECHVALSDLSMPRRRELIRILRDDFLDWTEDGIVNDGLFLRFYERAAALAQVDLVGVQWALSHPLALVAADELVGPALEMGDPKIPLQAFDDLVAHHVKTESAESLRKTRTVLLGALENIGTLVTRGTGQHRSLEAARGAPHPMAFGYLVLYDLQNRKIDAMISSEVAESSLPMRLTQCFASHGRQCIEWNIKANILCEHDDEIGVANVPGGFST